MKLLASLFGGPRRPADVSIFFRFQRPPYGGGNQFLLALRGELERQGLRVVSNDLPPGTRACLFNSHNFDGERLRRERRPGCLMVHRVDGPIDVYRGSKAGVDDMIAALNLEFADVTVFQSEYSLRAHAELGLDLVQPLVIRNAVDPRIFHPPARMPTLGGRKVRVVSTSWSANPNKGGPTYKWLEAHLDQQRYEFTFVGRSSEELRRARSLPPLTSTDLARFLRSQDVYLAASLHDPSSNALLEALACGLPAAFARSGGHPEIVGDAGIGYDSVEEIPEVLDRLVAEYAQRRAAIAIPELSDVAAAYRAALGVASARSGL